MSSSQQPFTDRRHYLETGIALGDIVSGFGAKMKPVAKSRNGRSDAEQIESGWCESLPAKFDYQGHTVEVITSSADDGWNAKSRFWVDLVLVWRGVPFFYNLKAGYGKAADNVCGLAGVGYLLGSPMASRLRAGNQTENAITDQLLAVLNEAERFEWGSQFREYFCIHLNRDDNTFRTLPLTALRDDDVRVNTQNGLQINFSTAQIKTLGRNQQQSGAFIAVKTVEYFERRARPYLKISKSQAKPCASAAS